MSLTEMDASDHAFRRMVACSFNGHHARGDAGNYGVTTPLRDRVLSASIDNDGTVLPKINARYILLFIYVLIANSFGHESSGKST